MNANEIREAVRSDSVSQLSLPLEEVITFPSGATRNDDSEKLDYEGFFSPIALQIYAEYMHKHRIQADGKLRESDNWQKGMPKARYMKSLFRHFMEAWKCHREHNTNMAALRDALCGVLFNAFGYLHSLQNSAD